MRAKVNSASESAGGNQADAAGVQLPMELHDCSAPSSQGVGAAVFLSWSRLSDAPDAVQLHDATTADCERSDATAQGDVDTDDELANMNN